MNEKEEKELTLAIRIDNKDKLRKILGSFPDDTKIEKQLAKALYSAVFYKKFDSLEILLDFGVNVDTLILGHDKALHVAVRCGYIRIVELLVKKGCNINAEDTQGSTAAIIAAEKGFNEILSHLCVKGADLNLKKRDGSTVLICAVKLGNVKVVQILLEMYAKDHTCMDINTSDKNGQTALIYAALGRQHFLVKILCDQGANPNVQNPISGQTALHYAALNNDFEVFEVLKSAGACLNIINKNGRTPLSYATEKMKQVMIIAGAYSAEDTFNSLPFHGGIQSIDSFVSKPKHKDMNHFLLDIEQNDETKITEQFSYSVNEEVTYQKPQYEHINGDHTETFDGVNMKETFDKTRISKNIITNFKKSLSTYIKEHTISSVNSSSSRNSSHKPRHIHFNEFMIININVFGNAQFGDYNVINQNIAAQDTNVQDERKDQDKETTENYEFDASTKSEAGVSDDESFTTVLDAQNIGDIGALPNASCEDKQVSNEGHGIIDRDVSNRNSKDENEKNEAFASSIDKSSLPLSNSSARKYNVKNVSFGPDEESSERLYTDEMKPHENRFEQTIDGVKDNAIENDYSDIDMFTEWNTTL